jgi:DNA polymerase
MWAFVDIESFGSADLPQVGAFRYAEDPDTELLGIGVLLVDDLAQIREVGPAISDRVEIVHAWRGETISVEVAAVLTDPATRITSWGSFDRILLDEFGLGARHGWPAHLSGSWLNGQDVAAACNLPLDLAHVVKAIGLREADGTPSEKDPRGEELIKKYSKPELVKPRKLKARGKHQTQEVSQLQEARLVRHYFADNPAHAHTMFETYMRQDVALLARTIAILPALSDFEGRVAEATWILNKQGVRIDVELAEILLRVHAWLKTQAQEAAEERYGVNLQSSAQMISALREYGFSCPLHPIKGTPSIEKKWMQPAIARLGDGIDPRARDLIELRALVSNTSLTKAESALRRISRDGRVRDMFIYRAQITDRWSSRELQLQNLPRPRFTMTPVDVDTLVQLFKSCADITSLSTLVQIFFGASLPDAAVSLIRSLIIPANGHALVIADYKTIEVVTNWMAAGEYGGLAALAAGVDEYTAFTKTLLTRIEASLRMTNDPDLRRELEIAQNLVKKDPRAIGKTGLLSIQYGTSAWGLAQQSNIPVTLADLMIREYNERYPSVSRHQQALVDAAIATVRDKIAYRVPPLDLWFHYVPALPGSNLDMLVMTRPSGEQVRYLRPRLETEQRRGVVHTQVTHEIYEVKGKTYRRPLKMTDQAENCASSIARDGLAYALVRLTDAGPPVIMAVHDELVSEVLSVTAPTSKSHMETLMEQPPPWWDPHAPLRVEAAIVSRYQKI